MRIKRTREISLEKLIWNNRIRKRINKRLTIGMLIFLVSFFVLFYAYQSLSPPLQNQVQIIGNVISEFSGEPTTALIDVDFNDEVGRVREDFYGVGLQSPKLVSGSIDTNCDGIYETPRNYTWQQETFLNSKAKIAYYDANLENYYSNTSDASGVNITRDLTNMQDQLTWDYENNITSVIILDYMPIWLADNSSGNCLDLRFCPASNYTKWNNIVLDYYKRVDKYRNRTKCQIWNEPDIFFFEGKLAENSAKTDFVILFNNTYNTFEDYNSNIEILGWRGASYAITTSSISAFTQMMLSNLSSQHKSFSYHPYSPSGYGYTDSNLISDEVTYLLNRCAVYGAECSHIYLNEWHPRYSTRNESNAQTPRYKAEISMFLQDILNHYPESVSEFYYHWDDSVSYFNCPSRYGEYPSFWSSVSEAGLDNPTPTYYPPYTVTKSFATYHSAGSMIVRSNSSSSNVKVVASKKQDNSQYITVINTGANTSILLNVIENSSSALKDLETNEVYISNNNIINIGVLDQYEIKYLINTNEIPTQNIPATPSSEWSSSGGGGGSSSNSKINANNVYNIETNETAKEAGENQDNNIEDKTENKIEIGKTVGTGKAILGEGEKYVSGLIVLLVFGIIAVLIAILTILYFRNRRNNLEINNEMQDLNSFKEGEDLKEEVLEEEAKEGESELEKYGLERDDLEKNELEEEKEEEGEGEENQEPVLG